MSPATILVAIDFSPASHLALAWALDYARGRRAAIHMVHVSEDLPGHHPSRARSDADAKLVCDSALAELTKLAPEARAELVPFVQHVRRGHPVREILGCAKEVGAQLLVIGSHGHTGLERMLVGSVAERVARMADCPVVIVKEAQK